MRLSIVRNLARVALLVPLATSASALQETENDSWTWRVVPYLWTSSIDGSLETPNVDADFEVDFSDIWDNLESAGLLFVEMRRDRFSILGDLIYLGIEAEGETPLGADVDLEQDTTILEMAGLYRFTPESPYEVGAGLRYAYFDTELEAGAVSTDGSRDVLDGFAAARATWSFARRWSMQVYGDVGAGDSDLTWQASAMLGYQLSNLGLGVGYRMLGYEFEEDSAELDFAFEGMMFGLEFRF